MINRVSAQSTTDELFQIQLQSNPVTLQTRVGVVERDPPLLPGLGVSASECTPANPPSAHVTRVHRLRQRLLNISDQLTATPVSL